METGISLATKVINHMLAPTQIEASDNNFFRFNNNEELEMRLRWSVNLRFTTPGAFLNDLERVLRPISEAITYGEVVDLRYQIESQKRWLEAKDKEIADLRRYRDAFELLGKI